MDPKRVVALVIGASVMVLLFSAVLVPITNSADNTLTVKNTNDYGVYASAMNEDLDITIGINADDSTKWDFTVNGVTINYPVNTSVTNPVLLTDTFQVLLSDGIIIAYNSNARFTGQTEFTATLSNDVLSGSSTNGTTPHTFTDIPYTWAFYAAEKGDYRAVYLLNNETETVYYTDINEVYGSNFVFTTNKYYSFHGETVTYYAASATPTTITANINADKVNGTVDMYSFDVKRTGGDYTFTVDNNGTDYTVNPWVYIVPYTVTSDALPTSDIISQLVGIIPIVVILGIVVGIVGMAIVNRYD